MRPALVAAILLVSATALRAGELSTQSSDCGGDAYSRGVVVEHRKPRRGPLTAVPDTFCADLAPQQEPVRVDIYANPYLGPPNGEGGGSAQYPARPPLPGGPPRPYRD